MASFGQYEAAIEAVEQAARNRMRCRPHDEQMAVKVSTTLHHALQNRAIKALEDYKIATRRA